MSKRKGARTRKAPSSSKVRSKAGGSRIAGHHQTRANSAKSRRGRRNSAPPPPKPRGGHGALAGEKSEPVRLGVRDHHTRSLCVQSPAGQSRFWSRSFPQIAEVAPFIGRD